MCQLTHLKTLKENNLRTGPVSVLYDEGTPIRQRSHQCVCVLRLLLLYHTAYLICVSVCLEDFSISFDISCPPPNKKFCL